MIFTLLIEKNTTLIGMFGSSRFENNFINYQKHELICELEYQKEYQLVNRNLLNFGLQSVQHATIVTKEQQLNLNSLIQNN